MAPDSEPRWISIIYTATGKYKILHLVALTFEDYHLWKATLEMLYNQRKELMGGLDQMRKRQSVWLKQHWSTADINGDHQLDLREVATLCRNLNISVSEVDLRANFDRADTHSRGYLDFLDFQHFVKYLRRRPEIERIVERIGGQPDSIPLESFVAFLRNAQKVCCWTSHICSLILTDTVQSTLPDAVLRSLFNKFSETDPAEAGRRVMTIEGFITFLASSDNSGFSERQTRVCDDMSRPLCEYFVSSSHNVGLTKLKPRLALTLFRFADLSHWRSVEGRQHC